MTETAAHEPLAKYYQLLCLFLWKMVAEMAENWDMRRGPPNFTSSGSLETVGSGILIYERLQLTPVYTHGQLCSVSE